MSKNNERLREMVCALPLPDEFNELFNEAMAELDEARADLANCPRTSDGKPLIVGMNCYHFDETVWQVSDCGITGVMLAEDPPAGLKFVVALRDTLGSDFDCYEDGVWADKAECERAMRKARAADKFAPFVRPDNPDDDDPTEPLREEKQ